MQPPKTLRILLISLAIFVVSLLILTLILAFLLLNISGTSLILAASCLVPFLASFLSSFYASRAGGTPLYALLSGAIALVVFCVAALLCPSSSASSSFLPPLCLAAGVLLALPACRIANKKSRDPAGRLKKIRRK